jgi:hypothetical protein
LLRDEQRIGNLTTQFPEVELSAHLLGGIESVSDIVKPAASIDADSQFAASGLSHQHQQVDEVRLPAAVRANEDGKARHLKLDAPKAPKSLNFNVIKHDEASQLRP